MGTRQICPTGETIWTTYLKKDEPQYIVTTKTANRETYYLYPIVNGVRGKCIGKAESPLELERVHLNGFFLQNAKKS